MKNITAILLLIAVGLTSGCSAYKDYETGTYIPESELSTIKNNSTTKDDIIKKFGHPSRQTQLDAKLLWYYDYNKLSHFGSNKRESTVFGFDKAGNLIEHYKTGKAGNALLDQVQ
jgi:outer membrane protein assembly factor BamE